MMTWPALTTLVVSFLTDFILTAGGTVSGGMLGQETVSMPPTPVWVLAIILGLMAAARRAQALVSAPPWGLPAPPVTTTTTTVPTPGLPTQPTTVTKTEPAPPSKLDAKPAGP